jgi:rRNA-processing protein FCF1
MALSAVNVALDTNILLDMVRLKIDIFAGIHDLVGNCTFCVPIQVKQELQTLSIEKGKHGAAARVALESLSTYHVKIVSATGEGGDQALRELAQKGYIVATNDRTLRQSLKNTPQRVIVVRQSKYVAWL